MALVLLSFSCYSRSFFLLSSSSIVDGAAVVVVGRYNPFPGVIDGVPASRDYEGGFASALMLKDLGSKTRVAFVVIKNSMSDVR
mgnify:CR=1 FL=1